MVLEQWREREGVLQEHLEYLASALKALQGSGVVRSKPDRKSCCSTGKGGGNSTLKGERSPGQALAGTGRSHTEFTPLVSPLQLSKEEFNPEFC